VLQVIPAMQEIVVEAAVAVEEVLYIALDVKVAMDKLGLVVVVVLIQDKEPGEM
jgi:hypothetical protein